MGIRELRERYGKSLKGRQAVNAAIRAELIAGNEVLDLLAILDADRSLATEGKRALTLAIAAREALAREIADRYGLGRTEED